MNYQEMQYEELKTLHLEIGQLLQTRKEEAKEQLKAQMLALGLKPQDLEVKPVKGNGKLYRDPDNPENTWSGGRGRKPAWLSTALESGRQLEDFIVAS